MKTITYRYLNRQYIFTKDTYANFTLVDTSTNTEVGLPTIINHMIKIFGLEESEACNYIDTWMDEQAILIPKGKLENS